MYIIRMRLHLGLVDKKYKKSKDWKSVIVGVWAAPGAPETQGLRGSRGRPNPSTIRVGEGRFSAITASK